MERYRADALAGPLSSRSDDLNEPLLALPPVSTAPPTSDELPPASKVALILEAENEIRSLERDLREVEALEQRGIVGASKLAGEFARLWTVQLLQRVEYSLILRSPAEHEPLKSELAQVKTALVPISTSYASLETRTNALLSRYNDYVCSSSLVGSPSRADLPLTLLADLYALRNLHLVERYRLGCRGGGHQARKGAEPGARHFLDLAPKD